MSISRSKNNDPALADAIERILLEMNGHPTDSPEYLASLAMLERLVTVQTQSRPSRVSRDTLALVAGNLGGIAMIILFEERHIFNSAAKDFVKTLIKR